MKKPSAIVMQFAFTAGLVSSVATGIMGCAEDANQVPGQPSMGGKADGPANNKKDGDACRILVKEQGEEPNAEWLALAGPQKTDWTYTTHLVESCGSDAFCAPPAGWLGARTESHCVGFDRFRAPALAEIAKVSPTLLANVTGHSGRTKLVWYFDGRTNAFVDVELDDAAGKPAAYVTMTPQRKPLGGFSVWRMGGPFAGDWYAPEVVRVRFHCTDLDNAYMNPLDNAEQRQAKCDAKLEQAFANLANKLAAQGIKLGEHSAFTYNTAGTGIADGEVRTQLDQEAATARAATESAYTDLNEHGYDIYATEIRPGANTIMPQWNKDNTIVHEM